MSDVAIVLLAAGASTRMGGADKLLEFVEGTPLVLRQLRRCCAASAQVRVVLPSGDSKRRAWLTDSPAQIVDVTERAMSASLRAGLSGLRTQAALIVLADMPDVTTQDMETMIAAQGAAPDEILRATCDDGTPGLPVLFPGCFFPEITALTGDEGARTVIDRHGARPIALPGQHARTDLDTPEDWAAWRAGQS